MNKSSKIWMVAVIGVVAAFVVATQVLHPSFLLTTLTDMVEALLVASGAASFVPVARRAKGRMRLFWSLIILWTTLWCGYEFCWVYFEILVRREVPDLFAGDVILFLNIVPLMAALALRPHVPRDEYAARLGRLDFTLLLVWWIYLYILIVIPWQYVVPNISAYNNNLNQVYSVEKLVLLTGLAASWIASKGQWRKLYGSLFEMSFAYAASSALANWAIGRKLYYSGSIYDVPLAISMAWVTWIGLRARTEAPEDNLREVTTVYGVWVARCGMIAVFSLPLFAAWAMSDDQIPPPIRDFRLALTLLAAFFMGVMVFVRQYLLDRELTQLLHQSRESFDNLKRLQAQLLQTEKLASIGQLVGGAAHELNNPITAMLGYSDILLSTPLTPAQAPLAAKIGQYVRRTKSLVASLISFSRQAPSPKTPLDLNTLARTAVKLTQPQWETLKIEVRTQFDAGLPKVIGDSNQLLQVCLQLVGNCLYVMSESGARKLTLTTKLEDEMAVLFIAIEAMPSLLPRAASLVDPEDGLGMSACQGILQEHHGHISREPQADGAMLLRVELPATEAAPATARQPKNSTVPVLWQSQPFA